MRRRLLSILIILVLILGAFPLTAAAEETGGIPIDADHFPDEIFRNIVSGFDSDGDGTLSSTEIAAVTEIQCRQKEISSLDGIEYFTALMMLDCSGNHITSLDVSKNTALQMLICDDNDLTSLDVSKNAALTHLECCYNSLTSLDVSKNAALVTLDCCNYGLTTLHVNGCTALDSLTCGDSSLTTLDVSGCTALTMLKCESNNLTSLDVSNNTALVTLDCPGNHITSLDVGNNTALKHLDCNSNSLTSLDLSNNTALTHLGCFGNHITSLDVGNNTALTDLNCRSNSLTSLDVSNNTALVTLDCSHNSLTMLDVSGCTALDTLDCEYNSLTTLDVSSCTAITWLTCYDNRLTSLSVSGCTCLTGLWCSHNSLTSLDLRTESPVRDVVLKGSWEYEPELIGGYAYLYENGGFLAVDEGVQLVTDPVYAVTVTSGEGGTASASAASGTEGTEVTLTAEPGDGYVFKEWQVFSGGIKIADDAFTVGTADVEILAVFEKLPVYAVTVTSGEGGTASASAASGTEGTKITLTAEPGEGYHFKEWQVVSGDAEITDDAFTVGKVDVEILAVFEADPEYTVVSGAEAAWTAGSGNGLEITVKRSVEDETCFSHFESVEMDGTELEEGTDYTVRAGSTVVTVPAETLQKLTEGTHTVTVRFDDGSAVVKLAVSSGSPVTGDGARPALWAVLAGTVLAAAAAAAVSGRRKRRA